MKKTNRNLTRKLLVALTLAFSVTLFGIPLTTWAHPLGNFTVNQYSRLEVGSAGINIFYVLDMAEIPTLQEKAILDANQDGQVSDAERTAYLNQRTTALVSGLQLKVNGNLVPLTVVQKDLSFLDGQGGLQTTRLTMQLHTDALPLGSTGLAYQNTNYDDRLGWREIIIRNADGVALGDSNVSAQDQSNELRVYPQDMLASPLNERTAAATFRLDPSVKVAQTSGNTGAVIRSEDPFTDLISGQDLGIGFILFAVLAAFVLGMVHAFSPGHGKSVVAAYLVGSRGTAKHAVFLGMTVTVTHTISVFVLGLVTLFASQFILPEKLFPWISLLSGLLVLFMGVILFRSRFRTAQTAGAFSNKKAALLKDYAQQYHDHDHDHTHDHDHDHTHDQDHDHEHSHEEASVVYLHTHSDHDHDHDHDHSNEHPQVVVAEREVAAALAYSQVGQVVSEEIAPVHTHSGFYPDSDHDHDHIHDHDHADTAVATHSHTASLVADHDHTHDHDHDHDHTDANGMHVHSPGGKPHTHLPPGADGGEVTWKKLLLFGISAGLLPCPSALIVMLSAIALNRVALGLVLIVFFSIGLAGTLTGIGLMLVYARDWFARRKINPTAGKLLRLLPVVGAITVTLIGIYMTYIALVQIQTGVYGA